MSSTHLTATQLQQYAEDGAVIDNVATEHLYTCESCSAELANYRLLFAEIRIVQQPVFDFDLSALIIKKLPATKPAIKWAAIWIAVLTAFCVAIPLIIFRDYFIYMFKGASVILIYLIIPVATCVIMLQVMESVNSYKKKMDALNFY